MQLLPERLPLVGSISVTRWVTKFLSKLVFVKVGVSSAAAWDSFSGLHPVRASPTTPRPAGARKHTSLTVQRGAICTQMGVTNVSFSGRVRIAMTAITDKIPVVGSLQVRPLG